MPELNNMPMIKVSGAAQALSDLGLLEDELVKEAFLGNAVGRGLSWLGGKAIGGLWNLGKGAYSTVSKPIEGVIGGIGNRLLNFAANRGMSPGAINFAQRLGQGLPGQMAGFGLFSGGINAAMADPGDRLNAFGRGFGSGALSGAVFGGASNLAKMGLGKTLGATTMANLKNTAAQSGLKSWGAKAVLGGVPLAAGMGLDMTLTPKINPFESHPPQPQMTPYLAAGSAIANPPYMTGY